MGCQTSRLVNPDILAIPPKLRPLLWRKAEEIRRRRGRGRTSDTLSKKELLMDSHRREESEALPSKSAAEKECKSPSLPDDDCMLNSATEIEEKSNDNNVAKDEVKEEERIESIEDHGDNNNNDDKPNGIQVDEEITNKEEQEKELEKIEKRDIVEEVNNNDNDDGDDDGNERNICPGSPSFRVYYLESLKEKKIDDEKLGNDDNIRDEDVNAIQEETSTENSNESIVLEDSNVNEEQETKIATKKERSRKKITRAIRRGPVAMKHLLNVKSCYHPSNERASLLSKKTEQTVE